MIKKQLMLNVCLMFSNWNLMLINGGEYLLMLLISLIKIFNLKWRVMILKLWFFGLMVRGIILINVLMIKYGVIKQLLVL